MCLSTLTKINISRLRSVQMQRKLDVAILSSHTRHKHCSLQKLHIFLTNSNVKRKIFFLPYLNQKIYHCSPHQKHSWWNNVSPLLRALNRVRSMRCSSYPVSHWIISICQPKGGHITLSSHTHYTYLLFETLSTAWFNGWNKTKTFFPLPQYQSEM